MLQEQMLIVDGFANCRFDGRRLYVPGRQTRWFGCLLSSFTWEPDRTQRVATKRNEICDWGSLKPATI